MGPPSYMRSVVDRSVVMRRMTTWSQHRKEWHQYSSFISQAAIHNTVTIHNNQRHDDTQYKFTAHSKRRRHLHYVQYTERSGPFIVSSKMPPAVRWAVGTDKQRLFTCYLLHVGRSWRLWNDFYERSFVVLFANCALKYRYSRGAGGTG